MVPVPYCFSIVNFKIKSMGIFIIYWVIAVLLFVIGIVQVIIKAVKNQPVKSGLKLVIASIIMLVIGAGACAVILSNLNIGH